MLSKRNIVLLTSVALVTLLLSLTGCNTTRGFGEDLQAAGTGISKASNNVKYGSKKSSSSTSSTKK